MLAANVDVAFLVQALPLDFNVRRLERYLAMAWESGAQPVVLLTKTDLVDDVQPYLDEVEKVTLGSCPVLAVSALTGEGLDGMLTWFEGNRTAVLLGSSGVGKSTIVNALAGEELLATQEVREDDQRGRHTTSHRELILLPTGGVVLDTPGIRELQLWDADLEQTFGDIEELARLCRFSDCAHDQEPGCAIREALARGHAPGRTVGQLPQAAARDGGGRGAPKPSTATGTRPRIQNPRTSAEAEEEEALTPPRVREDAVEFTLPDPGHRFEDVLLAQEVMRPRPGPPFRWEDGAWRLDFPRPAADRLEYLIGVDGGFAPDPRTRRAPLGRSATSR